MRSLGRVRGDSGAGALEKSLSGPMFGPRLLSLAGPFTFYSEIPMSTFTRIAKDPVGMARLVTNYARVKELQQKMSLDEIAEIFDEVVVNAVIGHRA